MTHILERASACAIACALVSACGDGGSGGGVNSTPPPPSFTSFANVQAGASTTVSGSTREGVLTVSANGAILPANVGAPTEGSGTVTFTMNGSKQITGLSVSGAQSSVTFDSSSTATPITVNGVAMATALSNASGANQALYVDPYAVGFNYQSYGVWGQGVVPGATAKYGVISAGAKTTGSAVPTAGSATFRGNLGGIYVDNAGNAFRYGANATFSADFAQRSISMSTSGDGITHILTDQKFTVNTNITGTLTYSAGSNAFSGTLAAGSYMSGSASGSFYGPTANELGGTFKISGTGGAMIGGFGAKQ